MAIIDTFTESMFIERFERSETYKHNFTREALVAIFQHLEECSEGISLEFDLVGIACEYSEYRGVENLRTVDDAYYKQLESEALVEWDIVYPADMSIEFRNEVNNMFVDYMRDNHWLIEFEYHNNETGFLLVG